MDKIYKVTTEGDCEGRSTKIIGYATGNESDIKSFYDDRKAYELRLEEIEVVNVTPNSKTERVAMIKRKQELEAELESLKKKLK